MTADENTNGIQWREIFMSRNKFVRDFELSASGILYQQWRGNLVIAYQHDGAWKWASVDERQQEVTESDETFDEPTRALYACADHLEVWN